MITPNQVAYIFVWIGSTGTSYAELLCGSYKVMSELIEAGSDLSDHDGIQNVPDAKGLYVWEGEIDDFGDTDKAPYWNGNFRRMEQKDIDAVFTL